MRYRSLKKFFSLWAVLLIALVIPAAGSAKSLYMLANHHINQFDAWNINPDGTVTYQATYNLSFVNEPSGMGVDADSATLFITDEFNVPGNDPAIELVNAVSMKSLGKVVVLDASGKPVRNLAGIDVDDKNNIVYIVKRNTPDIYVYDWDPNYINAQDPDNVIVDARAMRLRAGYPKALTGVSGMFGIALDEREGVLYVADSKGKMVKGFDTNTWNEVLSYTPSIVPCGIAVDRRRKIIYTTAPDLAKEECCFGLRNIFGHDGFTIISKYDITTGSETIMDMRKVGLDHGGMGLGVDEITGYLYVTGGCTGDDLTIWDPNPTNPPAPDIPFTLLQNTGQIGNPAALSIGNISYNPLNLKILESKCVNAGEEMTYSICYGSEEKKDFDVTNIKIVDNLPDPSKVSFISATDGGVYDPATNTVTWHLGDLPGGSPPRCVQVTVLVNPALPQMEYITNFATITSDQTPPTTVADERRICCLPYCPTPSDITINKITEECKAQVFWPEPDFGVCGPVTVISNHKPGDLFPIECGATGPIVTYTAQDVDGKIVGECTFTLPIVNDGPSIEYCPTNIPPQDNEPGKCGARVDWTPPKFADDCSLKVTSTHNPGSFFEVGTTEVTYEAVDNCGIPISCTFTVTVKDSELPQCIAKDITVQLDASGQVSITPSDVDNGSSDNCGIAKMEVFPNAFTCDNIGPNLVTLTVTDTSGNQSTCTATVTVVDPIPPEARGKNITVQLDASGQASITPSDVDNGSADNCGIAKMEVSPDTFTCADAGKKIPVTLTVTDTSGNQSTCKATVTVVDPIPPEARCKDITVQLDASGQVSITPSDVDNGSADNCGIAKMEVFPNAFTCDNIGPNLVILTVTDTSGNQSTCTATVTVLDPIPPEARCKNITVQLDASGQATITPSDVDNGSTDNCGIAKMEVLPNAFTCADAGKKIPVILTVTDTSGNQSTCTATVTVLDPIPPEARCKDITVQLDASGQVSITPSDVDNGSSDNCGIAKMEVFPDTFTCDNIGPNLVTLTVTDTSGNQSTCKATVTVVDPTPPEARCKNITVQLDASGQVSITPSDVDNGSADNCGIAKMEVLPNTFTCADAGKKIPVTLTVTDTSGNQSTCTATVTVLDPIPPEARCKDITVQLDASGQVSITPSDVDDGSSDNCGIAKMEVFPDTFTCDNIGPNLVTLTVIDTSGNQSTCQATVLVVDKIAPILISDCPGNINVSGICGKESPVSWTPPVFKDNCQVIVKSIAIYPDGTKRENVAPGDSFPVGTTKVIYTAKDSSGNEAAPCEFNITVEGGGIGMITPIEPCPPDITVNNQAGECGAKVFWIPPTFIGDCGPVTVTSTHNPGDFFPAECESEAKGTIVTYTARDEYGNEASCSFRVIVLDKEAPMVSGCPDDITVSADPEACGAKVFWIPQTFRDNCGSVTVTSTHEPGDFFPIGTTKVIYTATDDCGNKQECSFTVTVSDTKGPMIINGCPADITVRNEPGVCGAKVSWPPPVFSDNCGPVTVESTHKPGDFFPAECKGSAQGTLVTYTATDSYGNTATCSFKVTVLDEESPSVTIKPLAAKYFTTDIVALDYTVIDNCDPDPEVVVKLSNNGAAPIYLSPHPPISLNMAELVGQNTITVVATDECGNVGSASVQFEVVLRLTGDQLVIKDEIQKIGATTFVAFIHFPSPYDALTIYKAVADGAVADQINHDWVEHTSICRFNRSKVTEVPIDDYFEVNGLFKYQGISCKFFGADYIYRVLPPPRTPVPPPGQSPINPPIKQSTQQPDQQTVQPAIQQAVQQPVAQSAQQTSTVPAQQSTQQPTQQPAQQTVQPAIQQPIQQQVAQPVQQQVAQPAQQPEKPAQQTSTAPAQQPTQQPAQQTVQQQVAQPAQQTSTAPAQQTVQPAIQQPVQQQVAQPAQQTSTAPAQQTVQPAIQQPVQQPVAQSAQQTSTVPAQQPTQQPAQQIVQPAMQSVKQSAVK